MIHRRRSSGSTGTASADSRWCTAAGCAERTAARGAERVGELALSHGEVQNGFPQSSIPASSMSRTGSAPMPSTAT
jgi:hypothetical protein